MFNIFKKKKWRCLCGQDSKIGEECFSCKRTLEQCERGKRIIVANLTTDIASTILNRKPLLWNNEEMGK